MCWLIIILLIALTLFFVWASADVGSGIYLKTVCKAEVVDRVVALTFDDGPDELMTPRVLDVLKKHDVKATFFLIGAKVDQCPDIVRRIVEEGHIVASHTYSHRGLFPLYGREKVKQEVLKCRKSISNVAGVAPLLFRPPFGVTNPIIGKVVNELGLKTIGWSIRTLDTIKRRNSEKVRGRVVDLLHPGAIILLHDRCTNADMLLDEVINAILKKKYSFITLDKILKSDVYES